MSDASPAPFPRVAVVTVAYDSARVLPGFFDHCPPGLAAILVDNASHDDSAALAEARGARTIRCAENRGFGAGCNAGMDAAAAKEFVLLANPDTHLSADAIAALVAAADAFPDAAILAPLIHDAQGAPVRSWDAAQDRRRRLPRKRAAEPWPDGPLCADFVSGACMLVRMSARLRFDERIFLYYDDDDFCQSARAAGHAVVLVPAATVTHAGGESTTPSRALLRFKAYHLARSRLIHRAKWQSAAAARAESRARLLHHLGKALGHALTLQGDKLAADLGGLTGTLAWIRATR